MVSLLIEVVHTTNMSSPPPPPSSSGSDFEDDSTALEADFAAAAKHLERNVSQLDQSTLLEFYALYKQATVGACNTPKPGLFALQAKAKWSAWQAIGPAMRSEEAMQRYVDRMTAVRPEWRSTAAGGAAAAAPKAAHWVAVSRPQPDAADEVPLADSQKTCADYVKEGNNDLQRIVELLPAVADVNALDADGLALIHWAADRGGADVLRAVLRAGGGADVDRPDRDGQTALHYACSVGHAECVRALLEAGADRRARDAEGVSCAEVAASEEIRRIVEGGE